QRHSALAQLFRKFHNQNCVLARQPDQHHQSHLAVHVILNPRSHCAPSAPSSAIGTASSTINGSTKLSYCADNVRYTTSVPSPNRISDVPPDCSSSSDNPVQL